MRPNLEELEARADELAARFENYEPRPEDLNRPLPPIMALRLAAWRRDVAECDLARAVAEARERDLSWRKVGDAIGTSGEAARQRYSGSRAV
ncbi:MAG: hypothetical protein LBK95_02995 [Bifidobacteriaceae bacterium]|nr:hypothetical protein [Bifidobacteriaceae bacterium]